MVILKDTFLIFVCMVWTDEERWDISFAMLHYILYTDRQPLIVKVLNLRILHITFYLLTTRIFIFSHCDFVLRKLKKCVPVKLHTSSFYSHLGMYKRKKIHHIIDFCMTLNRCQTLIVHIKVHRTSNQQSPMISTLRCHL